MQLGFRRFFFFLFVFISERGKREYVEGKGTAFYFGRLSEEEEAELFIQERKKEKETMDVGFSTDAVVPARNCASQGIVNEVGFLGRLF